MFGNITYMSNSYVHVARNGEISTDLMNMHVVFESTDRKILGEIEDINVEFVKFAFGCPSHI